MSTASDFPIPSPEDADIIVCGLIGIILSFYLAGVSMCQFILCYQLLFPGSRTDSHQRQRAARERETLTWKLCGGAIFFLFLLDLVDTAMKVAVAVVYVRKALVHGTPGIMALPKVALGVTSIEGVSALFVQGIYIVRLWVVWPRNRVFFFSTVGVLFLALAGLQAGSSIYMGYRIDRESMPAWHNLRLCAGLWWGAASLNDILLCLAFIYSLSAFKTGHKESDWLIVRWAIFSLETGLISTLLQIATLFLFMYGWSKAWFFASLLPLTDVYINSVLVVFRVMLAGGLKDKSGNSVSVIQSQSFGTGPKSPPSGSWNGVGPPPPSASMGSRVSLQKQQQARRARPELRVATFSFEKEPEYELGSRTPATAYRGKRQFDDVTTTSTTPARSSFESSALREQPGRPPHFGEVVATPTPARSSFETANDALPPPEDDYVFDAL